MARKALPKCPTRRINPARAAREQGLAGATALRAIEGFGAGGRIHSVKVLHLSEDVPIVVEIIDTPERIAALAMQPGTAI